MTEEIKENIHENVNKEVKEVKEVNIVQVNDLSCLFIGEADTFEIQVYWYKDSSGIVVEGIDKSYSKDNKEAEIKKVNVTLKYPSHGDITKIFSYASKTLEKNISSLAIESMGLREFLQLEFARFVCLVRGWSLGVPVNNENISKINPKIVKAILSKIREKIENEGLI